MEDKNILIVEDDQAIRETLCVALEIEGYRVFTAGDGREGLRVLSQMPPPCLILLDLMMPIMDGWEFMDELKKIPAFATIPVLVVTAFEEKARTIQAKEVIKKPADLTVLFAAVEKWCKAS